MTGNYIPTETDANDAMDLVQRGKRVGSLVGLVAGAGLGWLTHGAVFSMLSATANTIAAGTTMLTGLGPSAAIISLGLGVGGIAIGAAVLAGAAIWLISRQIGKASGMNKARNMLEERALEAEHQVHEPEKSRAPALAQQQEKSPAIDSDTPAHEHTIRDPSGRAAQNHANATQTAPAEREEETFLARELQRAEQRQQSLAQMSAANSTSR